MQDSGTNSINCVGHSLGMSSKMLMICSNVRNYFSGAALSVLEAIFLQIHIPSADIQIVNHGQPRVKPCPSLQKSRFGSLTTDVIGRKPSICRLRWCQPENYSHNKPVRIRTVLQPLSTITHRWKKLTWTGKTPFLSFLPRSWASSNHQARFTLRTMDRFSLVLARITTTPYVPLAM